MGHWALFSIALDHHEKLNLQLMAHQPGASEDRPCVVLFSALMLACPAQQPPPHPNLLPAAPQHSDLCIEPGQEKSLYLCSEFCPRAPDISFSASSLWVRASLFSSSGGTNFHTQNSIQDLWSLSSKVALDFFLKINQPPVNSA